MPFEDHERAFHDILEAADLISNFTRGMDFETFRQDAKTIAAIERKLQIISEAALRLGPEAERKCPGQPWAEIRGIGNWRRHRYDRIELDTLWTTVTEDLPLLAKSVRETLS